MPRIAPTTRPRVPIINTTKIFPDTSDSSHPKSIPATIPVTINFRIFFANLPPRIGSVAGSTHYERAPGSRISKLDVAAGSATGGWSDPVYGGDLHPAKYS